jgi:competence protein ComEA
MKHFKSLMASALIAGAFFSAPAFSEPVKQAEAISKSASAQVANVASVSAVNINTADAVTIADHLNGIGLKKAQAIVSYREQNGPFKSVDDIVNVTGIGEATLEKNRSLIVIN